MAQATTGTVASTVKAYYEKQFLLRAEENLVYESLGMAGQIPEGEGNTVVWNRMTNIAAATSTLTEGTDPTAVGLSAVLVSATLGEYGNLVQVSKKLEMTAINTLMKNAMDALAYNAADSIDTVVRDVLVTGGTAQYVSGSYAGVARNSIAATDTFNVAAIRRAKRQLERFAAQPHSKDRFVAVTHPDVIFDLEGDSNWVNAHIYTEKGINSIYNGEAGEIYGTRFVSTSKAPVLTNSGSAGTEVYVTHLIGKEFFGVSNLQKVQTYLDNPSPRSALRMYADLGWKAMFAVKVLNDSFGIRIESAASA